MLKVLVVGQTPPPYHGQAVMIEGLLRSKMTDVQLIHARMGFSGEVDEVGRFRLAKVFRMFTLIASIIYHRFVDGARILYYPPGGPDRVPMFRDFIILGTTRWLFDKTIFHHHTGGTSVLCEGLPTWQRWLFRRAYFSADASIRNSALNPEDGKLLDAKHEYIIPNAIEDPCPEFAGGKLPATTLTPGAPLRILFVGSLRRSKGLMDAIEACGKLATRGVVVELEVMGAWQNREFAAEITRRIKELALGSRVRFLGVLTGDEKFAAYRRANVFCFPSYFKCETFGLVLLEAMACGLPVVATRWRGIPSVVDDGKTGFLVEPKDSDAVADRLAQLTDGALRERMGRAGRSKFEREFTFPRHVSRMRRMFLETAGVELQEEREWVSAATSAS